MQIVSYNTPNFTGRSATIKKADNIARLSSRLFPAISSSNLKMRSQGIERFKNIYKKISNLIGKNVRCHCKQPDALVRAMLTSTSMKKFKVGNCMEISRIANLICKINGLNTLPVKFNIIKNGQIQEVDHMALILPLKTLPQKPKKLSKCKDIIIIDPWLKFADYAPEAQKKYSCDYRKLLGLKSDEELVINPRYISFSDKLYNADIELLKKDFPAWIKCFTLPKSLQK